MSLNNSEICIQIIKKKLIQEQKNKRLKRCVLSYDFFRCIKNGPDCIKLVTTGNEMVMIFEYDLETNIHTEK